MQTTLTWVSSNPDVVTVNPATGLVTGRATGSASVTATSAAGISGSGTVVVTTPGSATTDVYRDHLAFGAPTDATPGDELRITRDEYVISYNPERGGPNWVSYNLNATHFGSQDRCNCFSADPPLEAAGIPLVVTSDYTGGGYDRGHMVQSAQRTAGSLENATTFYLSNILPQHADNNQGPWLLFENYNNALARSATAPKELYVVAGGAGTAGTVNNAGRIAIPVSTWKVVAILPAGKGLADVASAADLQVIAINMPNRAGIRNDPWEMYRVSVDAVEALTGYDLLSALPDEIESAVEATVAP